MYELLNLDILIPILSMMGSLKLMDTGVTYPDPSTLPKPILGYSLCKLIQYPDNDAWLFTSAFGTSIQWRGKSVAFSTWVAGQARTTGNKLQLSGWLNEANGWHDEDLMELVAEGIGYVYIHESGAGDAPMLTVSEYEDWLTKNAPQVQTPSEQPRVSAG